MIRMTHICRNQYFSCLAYCNDKGLAQIESKYMDLFSRYSALKLENLILYDEIRGMKF